MPHSTTLLSQDSHSTLEVDLDSMAGTSYHTGPVGTAVSQSTAQTVKDDRKGLPSMATLEERRRSSIADAFNELVGGNPSRLDNLSNGTTTPAEKQSRRNSRNSMNGRYRTTYLDDAAMVNGVRDRLQKDSPIIAELRTNVIIKDEFTLVTDLSYHLAQRYSRPDTAIMINIDHSACLALAGTFEPCYILTISGVPMLMQPAMNKRNAALIQSFMADILSVPPDRGVLRFNAIPDENLAINGTTMSADVERLEKQSSDESNILKSRYAGANPNRRSQNMNTNKRGSLLVNGDFTRPNATSLAEKRKSIPSGVFELGSTEERPSTSHGSYAAENGLRLNGISTENLVGSNAKLPSGRPKTFSGQSARRESSQKILTISAPMAPRQGNIPISPKPITTTTTTRSTNGASAAVPKNIASRPGSIAPSAKGGAANNNDISASRRGGTEPKLIDRAASSAAADKKDPANTAKRRSTLTATPKMPPPPPEPVDKSDTKSQKVSKRKSFLSAFRR